LGGIFFRVTGLITIGIWCYVALLAFQLITLPVEFDVFKVGQVITVEPGLYYPGLGGVRTEDVVAITKSGIRMLSRFENNLEL
jgi:Xaa-Pro aminopeptidase